MPNDVAQSDRLLLHIQFELETPKMRNEEPDASFSSGCVLLQRRSPVRKKTLRLPIHLLRPCPYPTAWRFRGFILSSAVVTTCSGFALKPLNGICVCIMCSTQSLSIFSAAGFVVRLIKIHTNLERCLLPEDIALDLNVMGDR